MRNESTKQAWMVRLQEQANSGLGIRAWCAREGLTEASFHYWRKRLAPASSATKLIALPMIGGHPEQMLELRTPHGYVSGKSAALYPSSVRVGTISSMFNDGDWSCMGRLKSKRAR